MYGVLGQVWYLIVMIPDLCLLSYFDNVEPDEMLQTTLFDLILYVPVSVFSIMSGQDYRLQDLHCLQQ